MEYGAVRKTGPGAGGWVCEQHPDREWPHDDCAGPGMLAGQMPDEPGSSAIYGVPM